MADIKLNLIIDGKEAQATLVSVSKGVEGIENAFKSVGATGAKAFNFNQLREGILGVSNALNDVVKVGADFDDSLKAVGAVTGASAATLSDLGNRGRDLAKTFGGSATDQLKSFQGILSKFGAQVADSPKDLSKMAENVNLLAKAGGINADQAMNALTDTMLQLGLVTGDTAKDAENSTRVIDALASSAQIGAAEIPDVAASMLQVGVAAKGAGLSVEQTTGALQVLAVGGKKGSEAGIALRNVLGLLQKASGPAEETMKKLGTSSAELGKILTTQGLEAAIKKVKGGMDGLGSAAEKNAALMTIFGTENSAAAGILLDNAGKIGEFTSGIEDAVKKGAAGAAGAVQQANINMQSAGAVISRIKARVEDTFIGITQAVGSSVTGAIGAINQLAPTLTGIAGIKSVIPEGAFDAISAKAKEAGQKSSELLKSAFDKVPLDGLKNKLGDSLSKLPIDTSKLASAFTDVGSKASAGLSKAFSGLGAAAFNPITLGVVAAGAALALFFTQTEAGQKSFEKIKEVAVKAWETIQPAIAKVGEVIAEVINVLLQVGGVVVDFVVAPFQIASEVIGAIVGGIVSLFSGVSAGTTGASSGVDTLVKGLNAVLETLKGAAKFVATFAQGFQYVKAVIISFVQNSSAIVGAFGEFAATALNPANWFNGEAGKAKDKLAATLKSAVDGAVQQTNTEIAKANLGENLAQALTIKGNLDASAKLDDLVKKFNSTTDAAEKANIAEAIKKQVPGAVQAIGTVVDATGNIVTQYKVAGDEVAKFAKAQAATGGADLKKKQEDIAKGIQAQSVAYGESIKKQKELAATISADTAAGKDTTKLKEQFKELTKTSEEEAKKLSEKVAEASAVGVPLTGIKVDPAFKEQFDAQLKELERKATEAKIGEFISKSAEIKGNIDKQDELGKLVKKYENAKTDIEKNSIAKQLAKDVPGLVKETILGVDANGELIKSYEVSTDKIKENVAANKLRFTGDLKANQDAYRNALAAEGTEYQKNIGKARALAAEIQKKKALGIDTKTLEADFATAQTAVRGEVDKTLQLAKDYGKLGLSSTQAVKDLAQAFGISEEAARKMLETANKPIELKLDIKKLADDFDAIQSKLKGIADTGVKGLTQNFLEAGQTKDKLSELNKQLGKETDAQNRNQLESQKKDLESQLQQRAKFEKDQRKVASDASKDAFKNDIALTNQKNSIDAASVNKVKKDRKNAALSILAQELEANRIVETDERKRKEADLADKFRIEKEKLKAELKFGDQSNAAKDNVSKQLIEKEKQFLNDKRKLQIEFLRQDIETALKTAELQQKADVAALQTRLQRVIELDVDGAEKRAKINEELAQKQSEIETKAYLDSIPQFTAALNKRKEEVVRINGETSKEAVAEIAKFNAEAQKAFAGTTIDADGFEVNIPQTDRLANVQKLLGTDEATAKLAIQNFDALQQRLTRETANKARDNQREIEAARIQTSLDFAQREFDLRKLELQRQLDKELAIAGSNSALIAQAEQKFALASLEAQGNLRVQNAGSIAGREQAARLNELQKAFATEIGAFEQNEKIKTEKQKQAEGIRRQLAAGGLSPETQAASAAALAQLDAEIASFRQNEALKLDIQREFALKSVALAQQQMKERAGVIRIGADQERSIYDTLFSGLSSIADSFNASRNDFEGQKANLRQQKEEELRVSGATGKERLEIRKKYREQEKELDRKYTGGAAALAQLRQSTTAVFGDLATKSKEAFTRATVDVTSFSAIGSEAFLQLGLTAGAQVASLVASGQDLGKAVLKTALDTLQSLIPIFVAQIFGISVAQLGAGGVIQATILSAALQALVSVARAAVGFRKGGYTGDGNPDQEAGVVHKGEWVSTYSTTKREREILEFMHKGGSSHEYFERVYLPEALKKQGVSVSLQTIIAKPQYAPERLQMGATSNDIARAIAQQTQALDVRLASVESAMNHTARQFQHRSEMTANVQFDNDRYFNDLKFKQKRSVLG